jgi:hypothetical protein
MENPWNNGSDENLHAVLFFERNYKPPSYSRLYLNIRVKAPYLQAVGQLE